VVQIAIAPRPIRARSEEKALTFMMVLARPESATSDAPSLPKRASRRADKAAEIAWKRLTEEEVAGES
jgi:hypothetical protein